MNQSNRDQLNKDESNNQGWINIKDKSIDQGWNNQSRKNQSIKDKSINQW